MSSQNASKSNYQNEGDNEELELVKKSKISKISSAFKRSFIPPQVMESSKGKFSDFKERTIWTILMLISFFLFISSGKFYCSLLVFLIIIAIYSELIDLSRYKDRNQEIKHFYFISYYFFFVCAYYFYLKFLLEKLPAKFTSIEIVSVREIFNLDLNNLPSDYLLPSIHAGISNILKESDSRVL